MTTANTKPLVLKNSILWLTAMVVPAGLSFAFESTRFPWQIIVPMLLLGPMLASNNFIAKAQEPCAPVPAPHSEK